VSLGYFSWPACWSPEVTIQGGWIGQIQCVYMQVWRRLYCVVRESTLFPPSTPTCPPPLHPKRLNTERDGPARLLRGLAGADLIFQWIGMMEYIPCYSGPAEHWDLLPATRLASREILIEQNIKKRTRPALCALCEYTHPLYITTRPPPPDRTLPWYYDQPLKCHSKQSQNTTYPVLSNL
jgi:hypothetical protein